MERLIVNLLPVAAGGGMQNSLSFLHTMRADGALSERSVVVVREGSQLHRFCSANEMNFIPVSGGLAGRLRFETLVRKRFRRGQSCLTLFGPPFLGSKGHLLNVVGCAYSNLFYPEIAFWSRQRQPIRRLKHEITDVYRRWGTGRADYWVFETEVLARRARNVCRFPENRVGVVRMSPSLLVTSDTISQGRRVAFDRMMPTGFRWLFLCSSNPNKRLHRLPAIAQEMDRQGLEDFCFVLTLDNDDRTTSRLAKDFARRGLGRNLINVGPVPASDVSSLIDCCSAMCTFSVLESFSNNFVEAWCMRKPLVVTDADWAREACGAGAIYVDPENPFQCAKVMKSIMTDPVHAHETAAAGHAQLGCYPDAETRNRSYLAHVEMAQSLGYCTYDERRSIRWP